MTHLRCCQTGERGSLNTSMTQWWTKRNRSHGVRSN